MDVYKSPESVVIDDKRGNKFVAVLVGLFVDFGLTLTGSLIVGAILSFMLLSQGVPESEIETQLQGMIDLKSVTPLSIGLIIFGYFASFLGGYIAARKANDKEYLIAGVLSAITFLVYLVSESDLESLYIEIPMFIANVCVIYLGAWVHVKNK